MTQARTILLALMIATALPLSGVAAAQEDHEDSYKQSVEVDDASATITVEREIGEHEAKVETVFDTSEGLFSVKAETENASVETERKLEAHLHQLVEFVDENGNGAYDDGEEVKSSWRLSGGSDQVVDGPENGTVSWAPLNATETTSDEGVDGIHIKARAAFQTGTPMEQIGELLGEAERGAFGVDLYVFPQVTSYNGTELAPTEVKIDYVIENYPYAAEGTQLALIQATEAESEAEAEGREDGGDGDDGDDRDERDDADDSNDEAEGSENAVISQAQLDQLEVQLAFSWAETAEVDGQDEPVHTTELSFEEERETTTSEAEHEVRRTFALSYARGASILHDPMIGATLATAGSGFGDDIGEVPGVGLLATLGLLAATGLAAGAAALPRR